MVLSPARLTIKFNYHTPSSVYGLLQSVSEIPVRALQVQREDKSASLLSVQRFRGKLGRRQGTFVLQGTEIVENGKIKATWFVVPASGTDELSALRGEGGVEGEFGKGSGRWIIGSSDASEYGLKPVCRLRIPTDGDQRSEVMAIAIPN